MNDTQALVWVCLLKSVQTSRHLWYLNKPLQGMAPTEYPLSSYLLSCLPACLPTCLLAFLLAGLPAYLSACLLACLLTCFLDWLLAYPAGLFRILLELIFNVLLNNVMHRQMTSWFLGLLSEPKSPRKVSKSWIYFMKGGLFIFSLLVAQRGR